MAAKDWGREIAAVSPFIRGFTVEVRGGCPQRLPGTSKEVDGSVTGMASRRLRHTNPVSRAA